MKKIILITILLISTTILFAQNHEKIIDIRPLNGINISLSGDASIFSINYERQFLVRPTFILSSKLGLGYNKELRFCIFSSCTPERTYLTIPHHITGNIGKGIHFFEFGLGGTIIKGNTTQPYLFYPIIGYRILPLKPGKFSFRIFGQLPFSGLLTDDISFFPFGLSFGASFNDE